MNSNLTNREERALKNLARSQRITIKEFKEDFPIELITLRGKRLIENCSHCRLKLTAKGLEMIKRLK